MKADKNNVKNIQDFVDQKSNTKSPISTCIKYLIRETNKNKFDYHQLKYIFRVVRERCEVDVPKNGRKLYELPTQLELERFYSAIKDPTHKLIFQTLEGTGLRVGKFCELKIENIDWDNNTIFIKNAKGGKDRVVPFGNKLKDKLQLYLQGRNNVYLFESNRNSKFSARRIEQICERYVLEAEINVKITPHTFRHIYNTFLAENKVSKENRMLLTGHESEQAQDIYTHLAVGGIKDEIIEILDKK